MPLKTLRVICVLHVLLLIGNVTNFLVWTIKAGLMVQQHLASRLLGAELLLSYPRLYAELHIHPYMYACIYIYIYNTHIKSR